MPAIAPLPIPTAPAAQQRWPSVGRIWRRQFFDIAKSPPAPIAAEALKRIAELYAIAAEIRGTSAAARRAVRQEKTRPLVEALKRWLEKTLTQLAGGSTIAQAVRYGLSR
jgi:transposase